MRKFMIAAAMAAPLMGCIEAGDLAPKPQIVAANEKTVTVRSSAVIVGQPPDATDIALAQTVCPNARHISTTSAGQYLGDYLFLCS